MVYLKRIRRLILGLLILILLGTFVFIKQAVLRVDAATAIPYMAWDAKSKTVKSVSGGCKSYKTVSGDNGSWSTGWYVLNSNVWYGGTVYVSGTVNLILCDGRELSVDKGICGDEGSTLNIYAQSTGTNAGKINTNSNDVNAAIGGRYSQKFGNITIHGGIINATATGNRGAGIGAGYDGSCGNITIHGGIVTATSASAAGIGGSDGGSCGTITINGGTITATAGNNAAGIGSGYGTDCKDITINGGNITAKGGYSGAGIGSGYNAKCGNITITGGDINATGGGCAAGIGGGNGAYNSSLGNITITGGNITAAGGDWASGIGIGDGGPCGTITITNQVTSLTASKGGGSGNSIGGGSTVTVCDVAGAIGENPYTAPTITFHANEGKILDTTIPKIYRTGAVVNLPTNLTREHFNFVGWCDNEELTGDTVTSMEATATGDKDFYAKWERIKHNITYNTNEGEWTGEYDTQYGEGLGLTLPTNIAKEHFAFAGWYTNSDCSGNAVTKIGTDATSDVTLWAKWLPVHTITYNLNEGTINGTYPEEYVETIGVTLPTDVTKVRSAFLGWYTNSDLTGDPVTLIGTDATSDVTLWAMWLPSYDITYNLDGGTINETYPEEYTETYGATLPTDVTKPYHIFLGWYTNSDFTGDPVTLIGEEEKEDKTFYAKWEFIAVVNLSELTGDYVAGDGQTLTGNLSGKYKISIDDGATVILKM